MNKALLIGILFVIGSGLLALSDMGENSLYDIAQFSQNGFQVEATAFRTLNLQVSLTPAGLIHLSWSAATGATGYNVYHSNVCLAPTAPGWIPFTTVSATNLDLSPSAARNFFMIRAYWDMPPNFVLVEGGTFYNGVSNVTLSSFYIDKYELTQTAYQAVMGTNPSFYSTVVNGPVETMTWFNMIEYCNRRSMMEFLTPCYSYTTYGTNPSNWPSGWNSNANHTNIICNWVANGYRLPTEMEWQFAARGGNLTHNYTYSGGNVLGSYGWYNGNSSGTTHPVGNLVANELGIYDMSGNVWEWVWDIYGAYPTGAQTNPHGPTTGTGRVERGGCWFSAGGSCTVAYRTFDAPIGTSAQIGFRVCRSPDNFVRVAGGTFNNGTSNVTVSSFYMDKFELTQAGYLAIMGTNPANWQQTELPVEKVSWFKTIEYCNKRSLSEGLIPCYSYGANGTNPVNWPSGWNTVSANHTNISCNWTASGYRLPTEMEWMFAAKGGTLTQNYLYSGSNVIGDVAWYSDNSGNATHTVGTKTANELGLYDMSGNVFEWVWDIYASYPTGSQNNPTGAISGDNRIMRGGSWGAGAGTCSVAGRIGDLPTGNYSDLGFRVVKRAQ
jgi:formylglycine-generating enzyme